MRTKALLCLAAVATIAIPASAQVYSANVVGYVNVPVPTGYSLIANPLNAPDNTITALFSASNPLGATVYSWTGSFFSANNNDEFGGGWATPTQAFPPGTGFFVQNPGAAFTVTFVGEVMQGNLTNTLAPGYSLVSSKVPQSGYVTDLGLTPGLGDNIYMWNGNFFVAINNDEFGGGWAPAAGFTVDPAKGPLVEVAKSFFYQNVSGTAKWERNYTVAP